MRRIYFTALIAGILIAFAAPVKAQISFHVGIGISDQPVWGPAGYDEAQYYYLPDIDTYYYIPQHRFYYQARGRWISSSHLPSRYRDYDLYNGYKVVLNEDRPYMHDQEYREKYNSYRDRHDQQVIRDSHESKYFVNKNHPEHNNWVQQQRHNNGQGNWRDQNNNRRDQYDRRDQNNNRRDQNDRHDQNNNRRDQNDQGYKHDQNNNQDHRNNQDQNKKQNDDNRQNNDDKHDKK